PRAGVDGARAGARVDVEPVVRGLGVEDGDRRGEAADLHASRVPVDDDRVVPVGAVDDDVVVGAVAGGAPEGPGQVDVHAGDVRAAQVVDRDGVGAAEGVEVHGLDAVGVHDDAGDVARDPQVVPVRGEADFLGPGRAVEDHRVGPGLALDAVVAVAGVPDERVVAGAEERDVGAVAAVGEVVAGGA